MKQHSTERQLKDNTERNGVILLNYAWRPHQPSRHHTSQHMAARYYRTLRHLTQRDMAARYCCSKQNATKRLDSTRQYFTSRDEAAIHLLTRDITERLIGTQQHTAAGLNTSRFHGAALSCSTQQHATQRRYWTLPDTTILYVTQRQHKIKSKEN